jgi:hypothetical protein
MNHDVTARSTAPLCVIEAGLRAGICEQWRNVWPELLSRQCSGMAFKADALPLHADLVGLVGFRGCPGKRQLRSRRREEMNL